MMEIHFQAPNFRAKTREQNKPGSQPESRLLYADDERSARARLASLELDVLKLEPYDFQEWLTKAARARNDALTGFPSARKIGKSYDFKSELWGQLKEHLQELFHGKCAYCPEHLLTGDHH